MKRVVIVQRRMTHYRLPLFERLREKLSSRGVCLDVLVGEGTKVESLKGDAAQLPWAKLLTTSYFANDRLCWQPMGRHLRGADLVVVTQENKLLYNHLMLLRPRNFKLAFWGHGANLQSDNPSGIKEQFKRWTTARVDWWFAYTQLSADLVRSSGFADSRITVLNNAVDTRELSRNLENIGQEELSELRTSLGIGNDPIGIFLGSLHADKRLEFLFDAAVFIHSHIPNFHLLIVGEGPERDCVQSWCADKPWAHWVGTRFGREKVLHMAASQIVLNPGMVGLGILDSFVCGVPMLTTYGGRHSPEIAYLKPGVNGLITQPDTLAYAQACVDLLQDPVMLKRLRAGCLASAVQYSLENMVNNFSEGIERVLGMENN